MSKSRFEPAKIAIIGAGKVGATTAYGLLLSGLATEIVLVDVDRSKAEGEVMDLNHSGPFGPPTRIFAGNYGECAGAAITIIAAGRSQRPGETRLDLNESNALILREIIPLVVRNNADGILLIATNPVDVLTYASWKLSGFPPNRVIGSGTILDTARFRYLLGQHFGIDPQSVHAYIIGEHGDSEVPVWSLANIAGIRLREFCEHEGLPYDEQAMQSIFRQTRDAAYEIIRRKGATSYALATAVVRIVQAILRNENTILTVSSVARHYGISEVCLSLPTKVNRNGADQILHLPLNEEELSGLVNSAERLKSAIAMLNLDPATEQLPALCKPKTR
jgi:L-lactate dehydrogenase